MKMGFFQECPHIRRRQFKQGTRIGQSRAGRELRVVTIELTPFGRVEPDVLAVIHPSHAGKAWRGF